MAKHRTEKAAEPQQEKPVPVADLILTRREYFVGQALAGLLGAGNGHGRAVMDAPIVAEAMLALLDGRGVADDRG